MKIAVIGLGFVGLSLVKRPCSKRLHMLLVLIKIRKNVTEIRNGRVHHYMNQI